MEIAQSRGSLPDVDGLEDAAVTVDNLTDWVGDLNVHNVFKVVAGFAGYPLFRRNDLG